MINNYVKINLFNLLLTNVIKQGLGPKVWNLIPQEIKESESLDIFYSKIKKWTPSNCPCKLCKRFRLHRVNFILFYLLCCLLINVFYYILVYFKFD